MIDKVKILELIKAELNDSDKFLVDLHISKDNRINVAIDGDNGIVIDDCITLSRFIESHLDRDEVDFELNVASAGLDSPLKLIRQYQKNVGRMLRVDTYADITVEGKLIEVAETAISLEQELTKKQKKEGVSGLIIIPFDDIKVAKIMIKF